MKHLLLKSLILGSTCLIASSTLAASLSQVTPSMVTTSIKQSQFSAHIIQAQNGKAQIELQLDAPAEIKVLKGDQLLTQEQAPAGTSYINTDHFPPGEYAVNIVIKNTNGIFYLSENINVAK